LPNADGSNLLAALVPTAYMLQKKHLDCRIAKLDACVYDFELSDPDFRCVVPNVTSAAMRQLKQACRRMELTEKCKLEMLDSLTDD
jgi:hypothetical protein